MRQRDRAAVFGSAAFPSDAELPDLVREVLTGKLSIQQAIKERVRGWQPDYFRA